jgi:hypothetical protein
MGLIGIARLTSGPEAQRRVRGQGGVRRHFRPDLELTAVPQASPLLHDGADAQLVVFCRACATTCGHETAPTTAGVAAYTPLPQVHPP